MKISLRPPEVVSDPADPFQNDLLNRKKPIQTLTGLLANLEGPCTLSVDAPWGHGKTTFLKMWAAYLRRQQFPVVEFNAWETDYSGNPFVTLSSELTEGLQKSFDRSLSVTIQHFKNQASKVARRTAPSIAQAIGIAIPVVGPTLGQVTASILKDSLSAHEENQRSVETFRRALGEMAEKLSESVGDRPLIIMIDELDRCRPSCAVQLLEVAKHLFSVDRIIFVLAINRLELAHSVRALYGSGFDAEGYLRRFFDADFRLPHPDRNAFVDQLLASTGIRDYFEQMQLETAITRELPEVFFRASDLSLRSVAQAIHRLRLALASLPKGHCTLADAIVVALIVRTIDADLYDRFFIRAELSDAEVVDRICNRPQADYRSNERAVMLFEALLIAAHCSRQEDNSSDNKSPLLRRHTEIAATHSAESFGDAQRSTTIIGIFNRSSHFKYGELVEVVARIELVAEDLTAPP